MRLFYKENLLPKDLRAGMKTLTIEYPISKKDSKNSVELRFKRGDNRLKKGLRATYNKNKVEIIYGRRIDAFRALGRLMGSNKKESFEERPRFDFLSLMIDCSRGAVLNLKSGKKWLRHLALMGINGLTLYTEDTYQVKGEPFFGYLRGAYTKSELQELDNYADAFGIEMFPCIQVLGHMGQILRWPVYQHVKDVDRVLLVGDERTYLLLEKMIKAASNPFRSNRIHIGMDETHGLGTGVYKQKHGVRSSFDIFNEHLKRVCHICSQMKLKPMIWDDMYFRFGSKTNNYYDKNSVIPREVIKDIPSNIDLVYWDYYHTDYQWYVDFLDKHNKIFGKPPIVAPGVWTWGRLWTSYNYAKATLDPCMTACKKKGIRETLATMWGDDGSECNFFSSLPAVQLYAEHCYQDKVDSSLLKANFRGSCQANFNTYVRACDLDNIPGVADSTKSPYNPSKMLLWDDPLLGLWQKDLPADKLATHYKKLKIDLRRVMKNNPDAKIIKFAHQLAQTLQLKANLWKRMVTAYKSKKDLSPFVEEEIPALQHEVKKLYKLHQTFWMENNKSFGFEVIESRYGVLLARLDSLKNYLDDYLTKKIDSIAEWDIPRRRIGPIAKFPGPMRYKGIVFPSAEV